MYRAVRGGQLSAAGHRPGPTDENHSKQDCHDTCRSTHAQLPRPESRDAVNQSVSRDTRPSTISRLSHPITSRLGTEWSLSWHIGCPCPRSPQPTRPSPLRLEWWDRGGTVTGHTLMGRGVGPGRHHRPHRGDPPHTLTGREVGPGRHRYSSHHDGTRGGTGETQI